MLKKSKKSENNQSFFRVGFLEAIRNNWNEEVKQLILENETGINNNTLLMDASRLGNLEILKFSIERGADINYKMGNQTALITASIKENWEMVKYLIEKGANDINNALSIALEKENWETVKYLVENGANDINEALIFASREGYLEIVKYLSEHVEDINAKNKALMIASSCGKLGVVKCLVENGADINSKDKDGKTALIYAVENGKLRIVEYLIENGIYINAKYDYYNNTTYGGNYKGVTILMITSIIFPMLTKYEIKTLEIFKYLIKKGADVNIEDDRCNTALDFVENYSDKKEVKEEIIKILIEAGAK